MTKRNQNNLTAEAEFELLVAEEDLILEAQMLIQASLNQRGMTQKKLAALLGVGPSHVSQMLGLSPRNLTLRTIARVMHALGEKAEIRLRVEQIQEAKTAPSKRSADADAVKASSMFDSKAWGNVVELPPRERTGRGKNDAEAYSAYEPPYLLAA
jgi:plasmid maintenance system antidote protein VapI